MLAAWTLCCVKVMPGPSLQGAKEDLASAGYGGILLGGNYVAGVALGKCVEYGYEYAKEIAKYLNDETAAAQTTTQGDAFFV